MRENGGSRSTVVASSPWRSKGRVLLLVLGVMILMAAAGIVYRVVRPPEENRIIDELPVYPGAREAELPATDPDAWTTVAPGFSDATVVGYVLPRGATRDAVLRYYGTHMPRSFSRDGPSCWFRDDARVLLVYPPRPQPRLDVAVSTGGAECPSG